MDDFMDMEHVPGAGAAIGAVILAAGKGTRMKSHRAKVLHGLFYRPMLLHVLDAVRDAGVRRAIVVVGHQKEAVAEALAGVPAVMVEQEEQRGTGHAVLCAEGACVGMERVLVICGDTPLIRPETLAAMLAQHGRERPAVSLMTTKMDTPFGYGRILRENGAVAAIVEEKDATDEQRRITEVNAGIYVVETEFLFHALARVGTDNSQGEMYLTDIVGIARAEGRAVLPYFHDRAGDVLGVNSRVELARAEAELQMRRNRALMAEGVTMLHPESTRVAPGCVVGRDCVLHGGVSIEGESVLGAGCVIEQGVVLRDCILGDEVRVGANSVMFDRRIGDHLEIDPLSRLV